ncbi:hypothetical protein Btru_030666 [Bulinus truncatus]|nr:hypothetical protein Btru_030666 [Bulinus truncatus]
MTYDYGMEMVNLINPSPIYGDSPEDTYNIKYAVDYYLRKGIPRSKLLITLPLYGRDHAPSDTSFHCYRAPSHQTYGKSVTTDDETGLVAYFEICRWLDHGVLVGRHQGVSYLSAGRHWAGNEDTESIRYKVMFAKRRGLAGIAYWSLDLDDVKKQWCKKYDKNLMETADETCRMQIPMSSYDPPLPTEPQRVLYPFVNPYGPFNRPWDVPDPPFEESMKMCENKQDHEKLDHPGYPCYRFIECIHGWGTVNRCPDGHVFDPVLKECETDDANDQNHATNDHDNNKYITICN